ncbi:MAG: serine/threonine-protein kinase [Myxococcota bacterium]
MVFSRYSFARRLAVGGMAEVLLARQQGIAGFEKLVVIKRILPQLRSDGRFVEMFLNEARLAAALHHPNIVEIYNIERETEDFFIVMEYLSGEDLRLILRRAKREEFRIPVAIACRIIADAVAGLDYAHCATDTQGRPLGLVHRDVGPTNLMVTYTGTSKLLDFGVAKANVHNIYTKPGTLKGKYGYSSPEQVQHHELDSRSDIFSVAVVLWELLTIRRLFRGDSPGEVLKAVMERQIPPPSSYNSEVPEELDQIVLSALRRDRNQRTPTARMFREQLEGLMEQQQWHVGQHQVGSWMQAVLAEQWEERKMLEQEVAAADPVELERTQEIPAAFGPSLSGASIASAASSSLMDPSHSVPISVAGQVTSETQTRQRTTLVIALTMLFTLILVGLIGAAYFLGRSTPTEVVAVPPAPPGRAATKTVAFLLHVLPNGARIKLNGTEYPDPVGVDGVLLETFANSNVTLEISKEGYRTITRVERAPESGTRSIYATLMREAETQPAARVVRAPPPPAPPPPAPPPPTRTREREREERRARTKNRRSRPEPPKETSLVLRFTPSDARVSVDGRVLRGRSPVTMDDIDPGRHRIEISARGYENVSRYVEVAEGQDNALAFNLTPLPPKMIGVDVTTKPDGAAVLVNGRPVGRAPVQGLRLEVGVRHQVVVRKDNFAEWRGAITPQLGQGNALRVNMTPLPKPESKAEEAAGKQAEVGVRVPRSRSGNVERGASLLGAKCNQCHGADVARVDPRKYTQVQWSRYFAYARHQRKAPLKGIVSTSELADIKAYLMANAADVESDVAAGIR